MSAQDRVNRAERLIEFWVFLMLFIAYSYTFPRWADPNQNSRLDMVVAIVEDRTFRIDKYVSNTVDYAKVGDHYYSDKAPGAALLGVPIYAGLRPILDTPLIETLTSRLSESETFRETLRPEGSGVYEEKVRFALAQVALTLALAAFPSALIGVILFRILRKMQFSPRLSLATALGYGLLTPAFAYAGAFYGHQLSAFLLLAAFYLVFPMGEHLSARRLIVIGLLLGYSVISEYPSVIMAVILILYTASKLRQGQRLKWLGWLILGGGMIAVGWMTYNTVVFGAPLELGYRYSELWIDRHNTGFMSLTIPRLEALWGITFSQYRGLFLLSPWLLLFVPGIIHWWKKSHMRAEWAVSVFGVVLFFLFNASSVMWWGGFAVGPRYLLPILPFMALAAAFSFKAWGHRVGFRVVAVLLVAWSLTATWGLTLADQAFPPDTIRYPLTAYAIPRWQEGNIARNFGSVLGLHGAWSLIPMLVALTTIGLGIWRLSGLTQDVDALSPSR